MTNKIIENILEQFTKFTHHKNDKKMTSKTSTQIDSPNINDKFCDDLLELIFFNINSQDLTYNVCLVCKRWYNIIGNSEFWKRKYKILGKLSHKDQNKDKLFKMKKFNILIDKNFLKNPSGYENFEEWHCAKSLDFKNYKNMNPKYVKNVIYNYKHNRQTPYGWSIVSNEASPSHDFCLDLHSLYFFTGFLVCEKLQLIDLKSEKKIIKSLIKQNIKIQLKISEFYSTCKNKTSLYNLKVLIINDDFKVVDRFFFSDQLDGSVDADKLWKHVEHVFEIKEVFRYVLFYHAGQDTQFFLGFYGTRIKNGSIKFII